MSEQTRTADPPGEVTLVLQPEPEPQPEPDRSKRSNREDRAGERPGLPAPPLLLAAANLGTVTGSSLYHAAGTPALVAGGVLAGGTAAAAVARRIRRARRTAVSRTPAGSGAGAPAPRAGRSGRLAGVGRLLGTGASGRRGSGGRTVGGELSSSGSTGRAGRTRAGGPGVAGGGRGGLFGRRPGRAAGVAGAGGGKGRSRLAGSRNTHTSKHPGRGALGGLARKVASAVAPGGTSQRSTAGQRPHPPRGSTSASCPGRFTRAARGVAGAARNSAAGAVRAGRAVRDAARNAHTARQAARTAWDALAASRRAARSRGSRFWRAVGVGALAGLAATWFNARKAAGKGRAWWRRRRGITPAGQPRRIAATVRAPQGSQPAAIASAPVPPALPAPTVRALGPGGRPAAGPHNPRGGSVPGFRFAEIAAEMHAAAAAYAPEDMVQVGHDLARLPEALLDVAHALRVTVQRAATEFPIHPQVVELLAACYQLQLQVAQAARDVAPAFRALHEADLRRHEAPRPNERLWNVA